MTTGKLVLQGAIELLSPALIGCGSKDHTDMDVLLDSSGRPFIPATSFIGVLRHHIKPDDCYKDDLKRFWGFTSQERISNNEKERQSAVCCEDLFMTDKGSPQITVRDGIKIDNKTGIVKDKGKYDYEVVERGARFVMNMEIALSEETEAFSRSMLSTIVELLQKEKVQIGAKTNSGLGRMRLVEAKLYEFDFSKKQDILRWFKRDFSREAALNIGPFLPLKSKEFVINATFGLKNSLIVRSYPADPDAPDAVHIRSKGDYVLPGSSLKGAIRARAERILNTLGKGDVVLKNLFGNVDNKNRSKAIKGRIRIDEVILPKFAAEQQSRIKIDRFTGGVIETALFETMPLFSRAIDLNEKVNNVKITVKDYKDYEAGLMLLVLKDLWTGDLAVGGEKSVGRGVFEGCRAEIFLDGEAIIIEEDIKALPQEHKDRLEDLVKALIDYKGGKVNEG